jgi:adenosylcobinamide-phosphate synthase
MTPVPSDILYSLIAQNGWHGTSPDRAGQSNNRYAARMIPLPEIVAPPGDPLVVLATALVLDAVVGDMRWLFRLVPHPVVWAGGLTGFLDRKLNREGRSPANRLIRGVVVVVIVVGLSATVGWGLALLAAQFPYGWVIELFLVTVLIAQRSLFMHVRAVGRALQRDGLQAGREAVSHIVGRRTDRLDEHGVVRAAIESLAENFADGVAAPAFWYALLGLPGIFAYKAINTMDSMIGYKSDRYRHFGMAAARLDDVANLVPARLSGLLFVLAAVASPTANPFRAFRIMWRDSRKHDSPNAGWPEAAVAGALDLALGGPRHYLGGVAKSEWLGDGRARATVRDIRRALMLYAVAGMLHLLLYGVIAGWRLT